MNKSNSVLIKAPLEAIFDLTSTLENWPKLLPHYRFIRFLERGETRSRVKMAAMRGLIPISWESTHEVDRARMQMRFTHLRAFTKGMRVVWHYRQEGEGVRVTIDHDMNFRLRAIAPVMERIIADGFVEPVATRTLATFKKILEKSEGIAETAS